MFTDCNIKLQIPNTSTYLNNGCIVRLGRFEKERWFLRYGWYSWGHNRPFCGWYLESQETKTVKPLQLTDLDDIYEVTQ